MTQLELNEVLTRHEMWLDCVPGGKQADLTGQNLCGLTFKKRIKNIILVNAEMRRANFENCDLTEADMRYANLRESRFLNATLKNVDLQHADLSGADMDCVNLNLAKLMNAELIETDLCHANLRGANFRGANLCQADFQLAAFGDTNLMNANVEGANFKDVVFNEVDLFGTRLEYAKLDGTQWVNCKGISDEKILELQGKNPDEIAFGKSLRESLAVNTFKIDIEYLIDGYKPEVNVNLYPVKRGVWYFDMKFNDHFEGVGVGGETEDIHSFIFDNVEGRTVFIVRFKNFHNCTIFGSIDKNSYSGTIYADKEFAAMLKKDAILSAEFGP